MISQGSTAARRRWIEIGALVCLAGIFAITSIYTPQGVDYFAVPFFLLGSLLIDERDIQAASWTGRRPFVFASAAVIVAIPFIGGACSANGFASQVGSGVYFAVAPPALFLAASNARFHLIGPRGMKYLILVSVFVGLVPGTIYHFATNAASKYFLPGQPATNIAAVYLSCVIGITLYLTNDLGRRARIFAYLVVFVVLALGLLTESRTFLASTAIVLGVYIITIHRKKPLLREMLAAVGVIAVATVASFFAIRSGLSRFFDQHQPLGFFDGRLQTWSDGWELFRRYPLCGIGPHTFYNQQLNPLYIERDKLGIAYYPFYHAHNIFLNTLAEGGVIVGLLLLVLTAAAIYGCYVILRDDRDNPFGLIAVALMAIFLIVGLFENTLVRPVVFFLALFLGLGMNVTWTKSRPRRSAE